MQFLIQMERLIAFALRQLCDGNAGPAADDLGDLIFRHGLADQRKILVFDQILLFLQLLFQCGKTPVFQLCRFVQIIVLLGCCDLFADIVQFFADLLHMLHGVLFIVPLRFLLLKQIPLLGKLFFKIRKTVLTLLVLLLFQRRDLDLHLHDLAVHLIQFGGHGIKLRLDEGTGLVYQVDGFVRQKTFRNIAGTERRRGHQRGVRDLYPVEHLVPFLDAAQNGHRLFHRRLIHHDRLKTPLQSRILFDIFPVFIQGRGADAVKFAPGKHGL